VIANNQLAGFKRTHLTPGQSADVEFTMDPRTLSEVDVDGKRIVLPGGYKVFLGGAQPGGEFQSRMATFTMNGKVELPK
jgi:beta-glucosidase